MPIIDSHFSCEIFQPTTKKINCIRYSEEATAIAFCGDDAQLKPRNMFFRSLCFFKNHIPFQKINKRNHESFF